MSQPVEIHPRPGVTVRGDFEDACPGDRFTPPTAAYVDPDTIHISGSLVEVMKFLAASGLDAYDINDPTDEERVTEQVAEMLLRSQPTAEDIRAERAQERRAA